MLRGEHGTHMKPFVLVCNWVRLVYIY